MDLIGHIREEMAFEANVRKSYLYRFLMELQLWMPIWVIYLQIERGFSLTQITLLDTPYFLLIVLAEVPTGAIADRWGRRVSLMLGSALFAVAVFTFGIAENYLVILASYTVWGLALTLQSGADTALLYDSLKGVGRESEFQRVNGRLWAIRSSAALVALLIGAPIAAATSYELAIILSAGIGLAAVPVAFSMHESKRVARAGEDGYFQTLFTGVRDAWRTPPLRYIFLFSGIVMAATFTPLVFQQPFLANHGIETGDLGLWQAPVRAAGIFSALVAYQFVSRAGERGAFLALPITLAIASFALAGLDSPVVFLAFLGMGMVAGIQNPVLMSYVNKRIPSERRATMLSVQSLVGFLVLAIVQPFAGLIADGFGLRAMFGTFGVLTLIAGLGMLYLWNRAEREAAERAELSRELLPPEPTPSEAIPVS